MPRWTAELDAILLHAVFDECNISFTKALCTKIAKRIEDKGIECTAKAVEGRLYGWKKKNVDSAASTPVKKTATPKKAVTPKTPASRPRASAKKFTKEPTPASETSSDVENFTESPTAERNKRVRSTPKRTYVESEAEGADDEDEEEYVPFNKRVKTEPVNDEVLQSYETKHEV